MYFAQKSPDSVKTAPLPPELPPPLNKYTTGAMHNDPRPLPTPPDGSNLIVTDTEHRRFLLQQKDDTHPIELCRGRWALFGGAAEDGESPRETLDREIHEEMALPELRELLLDGAYHYCRAVLEGWPLPGTFTGEFFVCELSSAAMTRVSELVALPGSVLEGQAHLCSRDQVEHLVRAPRGFIASHDLILQRFLSAYE